MYAPGIGAAPHVAAGFAFLTALLILCTLPNCFRAHTLFIFDSELEFFRGALRGTWTEFFFVPRQMLQNRNE